MRGQEGQRVGEHCGSRSHPAPAQVVVGVVDPNPLVGGQGVKTLQDAGISVDVSCLEQQCWDVNKDFMLRMQQLAEVK